MKKAFFIFNSIFLLMVISTASVFGYSETGHNEFSSLVLNNGNPLLKNIDNNEIENAYKSLDRVRFWGWRIYYFNINEQADYVGEIIFSRSNHTNNPYTINYVLEEVEYLTQSITVTGGVNAKAVTNIKKVQGTLSANVEVENEKGYRNTKTEETTLKINVYPNTKITLRVAGSCKVTTAACKYYIFGIRIKKGTWETVDVVTRYYELYEEQL